MQSVPQLMPAGSLTTVPLPLRLTVKTGLALKVAVTLLAAVIVTVQVPVPVQAPDQPPKLEPTVGVAVRVTLVPVL